MFSGDAAATMSGDAGNDRLIAGGPDTPVSGQNALYGGSGDDRIVGAKGRLNLIVGGEGDDEIVAGDRDDLLFGDDVDGELVGDDLIEVGAGNTNVFAGRGADRLVWETGDGNVNFDGGDSGNDIDTVSVLAGDAGDKFLLAPTGAGTTGIAIGSSRLVNFVRVENVDIAGRGGADQIVVADLTGTGVRSVAVNVGDIVAPDNAKDNIGLLGSPGVDQVQIESEGVSTFAKDRGKITGGVTRVSFGNKYVVRVGNVADALDINTLGAGDFVGVAGVTGPTTIKTAGGHDAITAGYVLAGPLLPPQGAFAAAVTIDAGPGDNAFAFVDQSPTGANVTLTDSFARSDKVPLGISFKPSGGGTFNAGVGVATGAGADQVSVQSTLAGVLTAVATGAGDDLVAVGNGSGTSTNLNLIRGTLVVDLQGGAQNQLLLSDRGDTTGNANIVVNASTVTGFAGPNDDQIITCAASGGSGLVALRGSETLGEKFTLNGPSLGVVVNGAGGNDTILARSLANLALLYGDDGNDTITIGRTAGLVSDTTLAFISADVGVSGGAGNDVLNVFDQGSSSTQAFTLFSPTKLLTNEFEVNFSTVEKVDIRGGSAGDLLAIGVLPPAATQVTFAGGAGANQIKGPGVATTWNLAAGGAGSLLNVAFTGIKSVVGAGAEDTFVIAANAATGMQVFGMGGADTLDYSAWSNAVTVDLPAGTADGVASVSSVSNVIGGNGNDLLRGDATSNALFGKGGDDILVGLGGMDLLNGGSGRDILIGGDGKDALNGDAGDDILIAGRTAYDNDTPNLRYLMTRWQFTNTYEARRVAMGPSFLGIAAYLGSATVFADSDTDTLTGGQDRDWFWATLVSRTNPGDTITDLSRGEAVN